MPDRFDRSHMDLSAWADAHSYRPPKQNRGGGSAPRIREEHGAMLIEQLRAAFREMEEDGAPDGRFARAEGSYYEVELRPGAKAEKLERKRDEISVGATKVYPESDAVCTVVYVPDAAVPVLEEIFRDYAEGALSEGGKPPREGYVEAIRRARLRSFWTDDPAALPEGPKETIWWEVWCRADRIPAMLAIFERIEARIAEKDRWLHFPEAVVVPVLARRAEIEVATVVADGLLELRRGSDTPWFFVEEEHERQAEWTTDLAERTVWPGLDVPRVCLLDTGVNRAHMLIEPALSEEDLQSADPRWVATDNADVCPSRLEK